MFFKETQKFFHVVTDFFFQNYKQNLSKDVKIFEFCINITIKNKIFTDFIKGYTQMFLGTSRNFWKGYTNIFKGHTDILKRIYTNVSREKQNFFQSYILKVSYDV